MKKAYIPAFFIHGKDDDFIIPQHSKDLHAAYGGQDKRLKIVEGYVWNDLGITILTVLRKCMKKWRLSSTTDCMCHSWSRKTKPLSRSRRRPENNQNRRKNKKKNRRKKSQRWKKWLSTSEHLMSRSNW